MAMALVAAALLSAQPLGAAGPEDPSPFGVVCPWPRVGETGARWVRCGAGATQLVDWGRVEPERGRFEWEGADDELTNWDEPEGLTPLPILGYTAPWASSGPPGEVHYPPRDLRMYYEFVRQSVARYGDRIGYWEVWNEPNIDFFRGTIPEYVDMLKTAAVAAKAANPYPSIVFGGQAGVDIAFTRRCYELGAAGYFQVMAVHPYQWGKVFNDEWFTAKLTSLRALMDEWDDPEKPIWLTEIGWSTTEGIDEQDQARLLVQSFVTSLTLGHLGVQKVFWFCVKDWGSSGHGLFADNGQPKPSFYAYRTMTQELAGREYVGALGTDDVRAYLFGEKDGDGEARLVIWAADLADADMELRIDAEPVTAVSVLGEEREVNAGGPFTFRATPAPQYLRLLAGAVTPRRDKVQRSFAVKGRWGPDVWASIQPPAQTARPWLIPGVPGGIECAVRNFSHKGETVKLWWYVEPGGVAAPSRAGRQPSAAAAAPGRHGLACLRHPARPEIAPSPYPLPAGEGWGEGGGAAGRVSVQVPRMQSRSVSLPITLPASTSLGIVPLSVMLEREDGQEYSVRPTIRVAEGPTIEFFANSHRESLYLQPGAESGCSESCRFGTRWTYKLDVPFACTAKLSALVGAHQAGPWTVQWSQDGSPAGQFTTLLEGRSDQAWHSAEIPALPAGDLFVKLEGDNEQLGELVVTWVEE